MTNIRIYDIDETDCPAHTALVRKERGYTRRIVLGLAVGAACIIGTIKAENAALRENIQYAGLLAAAYAAYALGKGDGLREGIRFGLAATNDPVLIDKFEPRAPPVASAGAQSLEELAENPEETE